jgi:CPA2 family monovalent cation:H+ antiporter-2
VDSLDFWRLLLDIVVLLGTSLVLGGIFARLGQSPLVGFLLAGMLMGGPGSLQLVRSESEIEVIAELGVSLLLFSIGLEFSWARVRSFGSRVLLSGVAQVTVTLAIAAAVALSLGLRLAEAVAIGAMLTLSSTAVVLRVLMDRAEIDSAHGRNALAILLVQDVAVVPLAIMLTVMGGSGEAQDLARQVGRVLLSAAVLIAVLWLVLDKLAVAALGRLDLSRNRELTVLLAIVTGLGSAVAAHAVGISPALGGFVAGMFLGSSRFATQIRADVASLRVVLLTLFFGAAGMIADPIWIFRNVHIVLGVAGSIFAGKALVVWVVLRAAGMPQTTALAAGLTLGQIGEFAFVLGTIGRDAGVVSDETRLLVVSTVIVTLLLTPYVVPHAPRWATVIGRPFQRRADTRSSEETEAGGTATATEVLIVGFGPAGELAARSVIGRGEHVHVVDLNEVGYKKARDCGFAASVGDATQSDVLEHAGVRMARTVVITLPARSTAMTVLEHVRRLAPTARVLVRARYHVHRAEFEAAGAHVVVGDEEEVGRELERRLME